MPKTSKRHTIKAASSAHLESYLAAGPHSIANLAAFLYVHETTVASWLSTPGTAPAWTLAIMAQRDTIIDQRAQLADKSKTKPKVCFIQATTAQADKLDKILDIVDLRVTWIDQ